MFICENCHEISKPKEKMFKYVTRKRPKEYFEYRGKALKRRLVKVGQGWEIAEEMSLCQKCYDKISREG